MGDSRWSIGYLLIISFLLIESVIGHVRLTFPQARYPGLDFLDNHRTNKPCGVSKPEDGKGVRTTLLAGSTINVTWSMAYPHKGGFRIELLNKNDQPTYVLTPKSRRYTGSNDQTVQYYEVTLPKKECKNCGMRLVREAKEWGRYSFWSCADINIVKKPSNLLCNYHGSYEDGKCVCDYLYSGKYCQYKDECEADEDCGEYGECQEFKKETYPKKVCYCKLGYFGENCASVSPMKRKQFEASLYNVRQLNSDNDMMYWRIVEETNEIEVVAQFQTRSWVAIGIIHKLRDRNFKRSRSSLWTCEPGRSNLDKVEKFQYFHVVFYLGWKPNDVDESCASLEALSSQVSDGPVAEPESEPETDSESEPESEAEAESEAEPESEPESTVEETESADSEEPPLR